jgi:redox-regulated HSP33 family molecular chaperone
MQTQEIKAVTQQIYDPDQLPIVLKTQDVMNLCRCSKPSALAVIRKAEKHGIVEF